MSISLLVVLVYSSSNSHWFAQFLIRFRVPCAAMGLPAYPDVAETDRTANSQQ